MIQKTGGIEPEKVADRVPVVIHYAARLSNGTMVVRTKPWKKAAAKQAIQSWIEDYEDRVAAGYKPQGYEVAPVIYYGRVMKGGKVLAEWRQKAQQKGLRVPYQNPPEWD